MHYLGEIVAGRVQFVREAGRRHLEFWPRFLAEAKPREVAAGEPRKRPLLIFTDGAEEEGDEEGESVVSIGGLIVDPERAP